MAHSGCTGRQPTANDEPSHSAYPSSNSGTRSAVETRTEHDAASRDASLGSLPWLEAVREPFGDFRYSTGHRPDQFTLLETVGGGVAMIDADRDGYLDLFFAGGGTIDAKSDTISGRAGGYFQNRGALKFSVATSGARLHDDSLYSHGVTVLDYDQDAWPDLLVTGFGGQRLFQNLGDGTFADRTLASELQVDGWSTASTAADFDADGDVDIYVARYCRWSLAEDQRHECGDPQRKLRDTCPPQLFEPEHDLLFISRGDGTFDDQSTRVQRQLPQRGMGVAATDVNRDGSVDLYIANDAGPNSLFLGAGAGDWEDVGLLAGVSGNEFGAAEGSMGIAAADCDGNGALDLFVTNFELENNSLYQNMGDGQFRHATLSSGLHGTAVPYVGFGTTFVDLNSDGWEDLIVVNGSVFYQTGQMPYQQPALLYENIGGHFTNVTHQNGDYFQRAHAARGLAVGDLDNDGANDVVVVDQEQQPTLLVGTQKPKHWLRLALRSTTTCNPPVGAQVSYQFRSRQLDRWLSAGTGYLSTSDERILLPYDPDGAGRSAVVQWPSGTRERFDDLLLDELNVLTEGQGVQATQSSK